MSKLGCIAPLAMIATVLFVMAPVSGEEPATTQPQPATKDAHPRVVLETSLGDITIELNRQAAPITVENFLRYVKDDYYDGTVFHRVIANFMIQGGGFDADMNERKEGLRAPIPIESNNGLKNERGTIAMARRPDPNSATSQFFINVVDNDFLNYKSDDPAGYGYTVFGKVVDGMDVVDKIRYTELIKHPKYPSRQPVTPKTPVIIKDVRLLGVEAAPASADEKNEPAKNKDD
jgi:peptidyl-prolyl cis-trans isomerase A (cyclophilin A)